MLTKLRLSHFRCYEALHWDIPAEGAVLLGNNAQGKTSLMEGLCFALSLHSPRATRLDKLAQHNSDSFGVSVDTLDDSRRIVWQQRKLSLRINGAECQDAANYLADSLPVTWLSNNDMALVQGAAEERRRFLDFLGAQWHPSYRAAWQHYRKALKSRNALLRHPRRSTAAIKSYGDIMARYGNVLTQLRQLMLERLIPYVGHHHQGISGGHESIQLHYKPSTHQPLEEALQQSLEADMRAGFTTVGSHRDDFLLQINGTAAADFASEGQQRTLAIALLLAQSAMLHNETGRAPILLIDDVFGELDPHRRHALLDILPEESQIFITTTHTDRLQNSDCRLPLFRIEQNNIRPL